MELSREEMHLASAELADEGAKRRGIYKQARAMAKLMALPEWAVYVEALRANAEMWGAQGVMQSKSIDEMVAKEYPKGVLFGLRLAVSLGPAIIAERATLLSESGDQDSVEDGDETTESSRLGAP